MITLYHSPQTRSASIVWLLEELEVPYETKLVDFRRMDGSGSRDPANPPLRCISRINTGRINSDLLPETRSAANTCPGWRIGRA